MMPASFRALHSSSLINGTFGFDNVPCAIKGTVQKLSVDYKDALVAAFNKITLLPIGVKKPDVNGDYEFLGLNSGMRCFVVAFDDKLQYNAVIQDEVVPK